jgi:hypothetical protein
VFFSLLAPLIERISTDCPTLVPIVTTSVYIDPKMTYKKKKEKERKGKEGKAKKNKSQKPAMRLFIFHLTPNCMIRASHPTSIAARQKRVCFRLVSLLALLCLSC